MEGRNEVTNNQLQENLELPRELPPGSMDSIVPVLSVYRNNKILCLNKRSPSSFHRISHTRIW